jgi:hypothetical protein
MRLAWSLSVSAFAAVTVLGACSAPRVSLKEGTREYSVADYGFVLDRWTRTTSLLSLRELDTPLTVTATFESWDFRWAYATRYASDYRLNPEQRQHLLDETLAETRDQHRFYVALYGTSARDGDIAQPNAAWTVRLIDESGVETPPVSIERVNRPGALERRYFPYSTVWRSLFRIKFPTTRGSGVATLAPTARWFGLRFSGPFGRTELRWETDPSRL